eukprot:104440_1
MATKHKTNTRQRTPKHPNQINQGIRGIEGKSFGHLATESQKYTKYHELKKARLVTDNTGRPRNKPLNEQEQQMTHKTRKEVKHVQYKVFAYNTHSQMLLYNKYLSTLTEKEMKSAWETNRERNPYIVAATKYAKETGVYSKFQREYFPTNVHTNKRKSLRKALLKVLKRYE